MHLEAESSKVLQRAAGAVQPSSVLANRSLTSNTALELLSTVGTDGERVRYLSTIVDV